MARALSSRILALAAMSFLVACSDDRERTAGVVSPPDADGETNVAVVAELPESPEMIALEAAREALDDGQELAALKGARALMDCKDPAIRRELVPIFSWLGRRALKELVELAGDADAEVAQEAISAWDLAVNEIDGENAKALAFVMAVKALKDKTAVLDTVFQHFSELDEPLAVQELAKLIAELSGTTAGELARATYTHVTGGEIFVSPTETKRYLDELKNKE